LIWLARHGETRDNAPPARVQGWRDVPLGDKGREQARALAREAAGLELRALWSSTLARARETAEIVAAEIGLEPVLDERLRESHRGRWEGHLIDTIRKREPETWAEWRRAGDSFRFPGGESLTEHADRVRAALHDIRRGELPALVICHGGTIRCAFASVHPDGLDAFHELEVANATLMRLPE
jgi:probable phosphoglycerate mutase